MEPSLLRLVWATVEAFRGSDLIRFSDPMLIQHLLNYLHRQILLSELDQLVLRQYLNDRVLLIRDVLDTYPSQL